MTNLKDMPLLAFVFRSAQITPTVIEMAHCTGSTPIFDLARTPLRSALLLFGEGQRGCKNLHALVSISAVMDTSFAEFLEKANITDIWVELNPLLFEHDLDSVFPRLIELSAMCRCFPIISNMDVMVKALKAQPNLPRIVLKGCEAAGFVSRESSLSLYAAACDLLKRKQQNPDILMWGGIGTPEAAAAFLSAGAKGVVFESLHWLTDLADMDQKVCQQLSELRPEFSRIVGSMFQVPFRVFDKGNSRAVKALNRFIASLDPIEITEQKQRAFAERVQQDCVVPYESGLNHNELVPLGVEACFAQFFVERYGFKTEHALRSFMQEVQGLCEGALEKKKSFLRSPLTEKMGIRHPFIQGAMTWITDLAEFAVDVADAGGLPTLALGLMDRETLEARLRRLPEIMSDRPYAVNLLALRENPLVDVQLEWIHETKPPFVVIGAGDPSMVGEIRRQGMEAIYMAPNVDLLKLAFQAGARYAICEGNEAGGHVGDLTTLSFAQAVIELRRRDPSLFKDRHIILAGGICNGVTASIAALLGANAIQMGTVYLTTREIVEKKALSDLYREMILSSSFGGTTVTGEAAGLPVRSLETPKIRAIREVERDFVKGDHDEAAFRRTLESLTAGSLFIAARGLDGPGGALMDEALCLEKGQFMCGVCAGIIDRIRTVKELHEELVEALMTLGQSRTYVKSKDLAGQSKHGLSAQLEQFSTNRSMPRARHFSDTPERIAVTGFSMINSLGNGSHEIWEASLNMKSGITFVPTSRWDHKHIYNPRPNIPEKTYCNVGAFKELTISRKALGIPPHEFRTMSASTKETLYLAQKAIAHSGILDSDIPRERIGVLVSQNSGECPGTLEEIIIRLSRKMILASLKRSMGLTSELEVAIEDILKAGRMAVDDTTLTGRLNATAAGFICNRYGFMGPSHAVTAACASSLVALYNAVQMIRNGSIDAAVVGGGEEFLTPLHFLEFSALGALAGLSGLERPPEGCSRPFDAGRDGFVLGEGGGMIVIERESLAVRRGAHVHAYVTGVGGSNTRTGLVEPSRLGAEAAIRASFRDAGCYGPEQVDLIECHATGTVQGDLEEVRAIRSVFAGSGPTMMTAFKSQIGHTLGAAGINSLIRGIMAMKDSVFPPTINCDQPDTALGIEGSGLALCKEPSEWKSHNGRPRRVQVNAFGFGGFNYVAQLEESRKASDRVLVSPEEGSCVFLHSHGERSEHAGVSFFKSELEGEWVRLALVCETPKDIEAKLNELSMDDGKSFRHPQRLGYLARKGIHLGIEKGSATRVAFVFPGQGAQYPGMGKELYEQFPIIREWMDRFSALADFDLLQVLFDGQEEDLKRTCWLQPALFSLEHAMSRYFMSLGVSPAATAGHSLGEFTALCAAGVFSAEDGFRLVARRGACMDRVACINGEASAMMAVNAPLALLQESVLEWENVYICNINSPNQVVVGGKAEAVSALGSKLTELKYRGSFLNVGMAFHTPVMSEFRAELEDLLASIPFHAPHIPVISNTTGKLFPSDPAEIKNMVLAHLESPVHWMACVRTLWNDCGARLFVEIGPGDVLSGLIAETVASPECLPTSLPSAEGMTFRTALAKLYAQGNLIPRKEVRIISLAAPKEGTQRGGTGSHAGAYASAKGVGTPGPVETIIRREYGAIINEPVGHLLKRCLLQAVRLQHDRSFTEKQLEKALNAIPLHLDAPRPDRPHRPEATVLPATSPPFSAVAGPDTTRPETSEPSGILEDIITIIMDATGYERDEIEPDMDLKDELAIRSSRLPVIMDAAQRRFGITIQLEDFMDVRTIRDVAEKISLILLREDSSNPPERNRIHLIEPESQKTTPREETAGAKRLTFDERPLETGRFVPVELTSGDTVVILSAGGPNRLSKKLTGIFSADHGVIATSFAYMRKASDLGAKGFDIRVETAASRCADRLREVSSLAGLVFVADEVADKRIETIEDVLCLIRGFFQLLQAFLQSPARKFVFFLSSGGDDRGNLRLLSEGVLGMCLSAAWEYGSVQFRTLHLDKETDLGYAIRCALDKSRPTIETIYHGGKAFSSVGRMNRSPFRSEPRLHIGPGDVVVLSGGGRGITTHLARSFIPFGNRVVILGRTPIEPGPDSESPHRIRSMEIAKTLRGLQSSGIQASYTQCDVTDKSQVQAAMETIFQQHGNICGIIHGAGVLRDSLIPNMAAQDVSDVMNVKFLGAWHLFQAAEQRGLRCFVALSSIAAIYGNPGQANYASANRTVSALIAGLAQRYPHVLFKSLILPPIRGAGMAETPEIREMMALKGMEGTYVHVNELTELFCRELFTTTTEAVPLVMFMKQPPDAPFSRLDQDALSQSQDRLEAGTVSFPKEAFPLIDSISHMDMATGKVEARRTFSGKKDLWIGDHKPFKSLKHAMVSGVMILEALLEASRILYPYLQVQGIRNARFLEWIECPVGIDRDTRIFCERCRTERNQVFCDVSLASQDISPTGRSIGRMTVNSTAQVVLSGRIPHHAGEFKGFPVETAELDTPPMDREALLQKYIEKSDFKGRYCVVTHLKGTGPTCIVGNTVCRQGKDFLDYPSTQYQYSPYLLEAVFHLAAHHAVIQDRSEDRLMVPAEIEELILGRRPEQGEEIKLACRRTAADLTGSCWDAQCLDGTGSTILYARGIRMHWLPDQYTAFSGDLDP